MAVLIYASLFPHNLMELQKRLGGVCVLNNISGLDSLKHSLFLRDESNKLHPAAVIQFKGYVKGSLQEVWHLTGEALINTGVTSLFVYGVSPDDVPRVESFAQAREVRAFCFQEGDFDGVAEFLKQYAIN